MTKEDTKVCDVCSVCNVCNVCSVCGVCNVCNVCNGSMTKKDTKVRQRDGSGPWVCGGGSGAEDESRRYGTLRNGRGRGDDETVVRGSPSQLLLMHS